MRVAWKPNSRQHPQQALPQVRQEGSGAEVMRWFLDFLEAMMMPSTYPLYLQAMADQRSVRRKCPECGTGKHGKDPLCDTCYEEHLGKVGSPRGRGPND